jgi:glucose dehydrogenase
MCNQRNDSDQEHVPAVLSRREALKAGAVAAVMPLFGGAISIAQATEAAYASASNVRDVATEWLSYGGDKASSKYSPLAQISSDNFHRLKAAWTWQSAEEEVAKANHLKRVRGNPHR